MEKQYHVFRKKYLFRPDKYCKRFQEFINYKVFE